MDSLVKQTGQGAADESSKKDSMYWRISSRQNTCLHLEAIDTCELIILVRTMGAYPRAPQQRHDKDHTHTCLGSPW